MGAIDIALWWILLSFAMGSATAGLLVQEFGRADIGTEMLHFGIGLGWFLVVLLVIVWRDKSKKEEEEWERKESEMYARQEEREKQEKEMYDKQRQYEERLGKRRKRTTGNN